MNDVAIIGVGLHPFGRFDKTAMEMGAEAIQSALTDAGVEWKDIQFGFGGSYEVSNPDAVTRLVGLTGITFTNVFNACATAAVAIQQTADTIRLGKYDIGIAIGMDKHPRGAFTDDPAKLALPQWYAENGQFVTTKFFGMKANQYIHDHGISQETLAKVAAKNFRNGEKNPNAFRRKPISEEEILNSPVLNYPLTQYMFCAPDEGAAAVIMCRGDIAHRFTDKPVYVRATEIRTRTIRRLRGARDVRAAGRGLSPTVYAAKAAYEAAGIGPEDVDVAQLQDTDAGAEVIHMAETGLCADGEQEKLLADGATEIDGSMPINTDGGLIANGEPIGASGLRQVHELVRQLRGEAGDRQVPGDPRGRARSGLRRAGHRLGDDPEPVRPDRRFGTRVRKQRSKISEMMFPPAPSTDQAVARHGVSNGAGGGLSYLRHRNRGRRRRPAASAAAQRPLHRVGRAAVQRGDLLPRRRSAELGRLQPQPVPVQPQGRGRRRPEPAMEPRRWAGKPRRMGDGGREHRRGVDEDAQHPLCARRRRGRRRDQSRP